MLTIRSLWLGMVVATATLLASIPHAGAQPFPDKSVRMVIAFPAGGSIDTLGRILAQKMTEAWGQTVVVENRTGAGGNIGATAAAQASPDGYTLHFGFSSLAVNVTLLPVPGFDPTKDLEPIMLVGSAQDILIVPPSSPFKTLKDMVEYAKANPGKLTYGSLGSSSSGHLGMATLSNLTGIEMQQVSYTQPSQIVADLIAGRIDAFLPTTGGHIGNVTTGRVRALAVSGPSRAKNLPDVPTFIESGVRFEEDTSWYALFAPKGTPKAIINKVNGDMERIIRLPEIKEREAALGFRMIGGPPERLREHLAKEVANWATLVKTPAFTGK